MKQFVRFLIGFLLFAAFVPQLSSTDGLDGLSDHFESVFAVGSIGGLMFAFCPQNSMHGVVTSGIQMEIWARYIIERFWKDNEFLKFAFNDDQYVLAGSVVHIPQPGAKPVVVKNRSVYPATAVRRTDTDITYVLDEYTTDPTHIPDVDKVELSYDKMDSVLGDHMDTLSETIADDILIKWSPAAANFVRTTGAATGPVGDQTGNRKLFTEKDLQAAALKMNLQGAPKKDRYALIEDNMFDQFYNSLGTTTSKDFSRVVDAENGVIGQLHGFKIMTRASVLAYASNNTVKALGAAGAAGDNLASICWQKNAVARAIGTTKVFQDLNNPLYYGDIHSALTRMGGRKRRTNAEGVIAIVQDAAA
jgi:hypothetical protein